MVGGCVGNGGSRASHDMLVETGKDGQTATDDAEIHFCNAMWKSQLGRDFDGDSKNAYAQSMIICTE